MAKLEQYFSPAQIQRAHQMCKDAIGRHCKVRDEDGTVQHGKIVDCAPAYAGFSGRSVHCVFSVDMLCGVNERRRNFKLRTLPGGR